MNSGFDRGGVHARSAEYSEECTHPLLGQSQLWFGASPIALRPLPWTGPSAVLGH